MKTLITNELFSDFIECRYRGYLKITGASGSKSDLVDVSGRLLESYHSQAREHLLRAYRDEGKQVCTDVGLSVVLANRYDLAIDVTATDTNVSVRFDALMAAPGNASGSQPFYIPTVFVNNDKVSKEDELRLALCASVLIRWRACRPSFGRILHGSGFRIRKVKLARALEQADKVLEEIRALDERASEPPPLRLNAHCPTCVFRNSCRATAIEKDDLSLLGGIKEKEIVKLRNKGIFTDVGEPTINRLKRRAAELYQGGYEEIKKALLHGKLIHADETHMSTKGSNGYVWVFTSMEDVIYLWSATREGKVAEEFLSGFNGVLVSDFYSAYDSISCAQQKCLIHLIRDLNEDVLKEPFNEEMKTLVHEFAELLKPMIETIDRFGLKSHFLKKHKVQVTRFYDRLSTRHYKTELARKAQERFRKNQGKLFTFLDHDEIPWNNNNAEHAVKAFAALRNVIEPHSTESSIRDYLVLLSISQTCEYKGIDFLQFLRSGEKRVDDYVRKRHSQRSRPRPQETSPIRAHFWSDPTTR